MVSFTASGIRLGWRPNARSESSIRCMSKERPKIPNKPSMGEATVGRLPKDLGTWSKDFQSMPIRVKAGNIRTESSHVLHAKGHALLSRADDVHHRRVAAAWAAADALIGADRANSRQSVL